MHIHPALNTYYTNLQSSKSVHAKHVGIVESGRFVPEQQKLVSNWLG
jgi:hypothetical protein